MGNLLRVTEKNSPVKNEVTSEAIVSI